MPEKIAVVNQTLPNGMARVVTDRRSGCGGCSPSKGCHSCLAAADKAEFEVRNPAGARNGDVVVIHQSTGALYTGAVLLYLLPIATMLIGALVGSTSANQSVVPIAGGIAGLVAGFLAVVLLSRHRRFRSWIVPRIVKIRHRGSPAPPVAKRPGHTPLSQGACCGR